MKECAIHISEKCRKVVAKAGICSVCYNHLLKEKLVVEGEPFPDWLQSLIRLQDAMDTIDRRHECEDIGDFDNFKMRNAFENDMYNGVPEGRNGIVLRQKGSE